MVRFQASYANVRPAKSVIWLPAASYFGLVWPVAEPISFFRLCVRLSVTAFVVTPSQLPTAS